MHRRGSGGMTGEDAGPPDPPVLRYGAGKRLIFNE